jgi:hypothetical protein
MNHVIITRNQFERLKEVFDMYDTVDQILITETNESGIGPSTKMEYNPKSVVVDITDVSNW